MNVNDNNNMNIEIVQFNHTQKTLVTFFSFLEAYIDTFFYCNTLT